MVFNGLTTIHSESTLSYVLFAVTVITVISLTAVDGYKIFYNASDDICFR